MKCPYGNERCLCANCTDNAKYDGCEKEYCIHCYECEDAQKAIHRYLKILCQLAFVARLRITTMASSIKNLHQNMISL